MAAAAERTAAGASHGGASAAGASAAGASAGGASAGGASRKGADNEDLVVPNGRASGSQLPHEPSRPTVHDLVRARVRVRQP